MCVGPRGLRQVSTIAGKHSQAATKHARAEPSALGAGMRVFARDGEHLREGGVVRG